MPTDLDYPCVFTNSSGTTLYRASTLLNCPRTFIFTRKSFPQSPLPTPLATAFTEGHTLEPHVLAILQSRGYHVYSLGREITLPLPPLSSTPSSLAIIGHIDALAKHPDTEELVTEVKSLSHENTELFRNDWLTHFPAYAYQLSCYMLSLRRKGLFAIYDKDEKELHLINVPTAPIPLDAIVARVESLERDAMVNAATDDLPECTKDTYCPFWTLHAEYADEPYNLDSDPTLLALTAAYSALSTRVAIFSKARDSLRSQLEEYLNARSITDGSGRDYSLRLSHVTSRRLDSSAVTRYLRESNLLSTYQITSSYDRLTVTKKESPTTDTPSTEKPPVS